MLDNPDTQGKGEALPDWTKIPFTQRIVAKVTDLLISRKFYALLIALVQANQLYVEGKLDPWSYIIANITALGVYTGAVAVEDSLRALAKRNG